MARLVAAARIPTHLANLSTQNSANMIQQNVIGLLIELYISGGGNFLTQSFPTNFHTFHPSKFLTKSDSPDDWREVTPSERLAIEKADAAWERPTDELIASAKAVGAVYNAATGFFELNGLTDLTAADMRKILAFGMFAPLSYGAGSVGGNFSDRFVRTNILSNTGSDALRNACTFNHFCYNQKIMESCVVGEQRSADYSFLASPTSFRAEFRNCRKLKEIIGVMNLDLLKSDSGGDGFLQSCAALETIHLRRLKNSLRFNDCAALSVESIDEMVDFAINTTPITLTFHPEAYDRIPESLFAAAIEKQITLASA